MSYKATTSKRDQAIADDAIADIGLMCSAHGCPRRWTVDGDRGRACSAHYWASPEDWPRITEALQRSDVQRAIEDANREPVRPLTRDQRRAVLGKLAKLGREPNDPKAWAHELRERHERGDRLSEADIAAYRRALPQRRAPLLDDEVPA